MALSRICVSQPKASSRSGLPEVNLGLFPGSGGTQRLPRLVGLSKGIDLIANAKTLKPAEAKEMGLVDQLFPDAAACRAGALEYAAKLAAGPTVAIGHAKVAITQGFGAPLDLGLAIEREAISRVFVSVMPRKASKPSRKSAASGFPAGLSGPMHLKPPYTVRFWYPEDFGWSRSSVRLSRRRAALLLAEGTCTWAFRTVGYVVRTTRAAGPTLLLPWIFRASSRRRTSQGHVRLPGVAPRVSAGDAGRLCARHVSLLRATRAQRLDPVSCRARCAGPTSLLRKSLRSRSSWSAK